jgi:glycosyltransferase involved in cell wall biosynthesis
MMENHSFSILLVIDNKFEGRYCRDLVSGFNTQYSDVNLIFVSTGRCNTPAWLIEYENCVPISSNIKYLPLRVLSLIWQLRRYNFDIIQTHLFLSGIIGLAFGRLFSKPVIHTRHHLDENWQLGTRLHVFLDQISMKFSKHVVTFSQATKDWIVEREKVPAEKVTVINQGFDFSSLQPSKPEVEKSARDLDFQNETFNIICISRYLEVKGQKTLVDAVDLLTRSKNSVYSDKDIRVAFIGLGDAGWLVKYIKAKGQENRMTCYAARTDVPACIAAADLVCHPSMADSFSQLIIEAQAVGTPIIASRIAGAPEQILEGVTGIIVNPGDSKELANAIFIMKTDQVSAKKMGVAAKAHVRQMFSLERMIENQFNFLTNNSRN